MSIPDGFRRVTKSVPCPICGKSDWCLVSRDNPASRAVCQRVESDRRFGKAGWLHNLRFNIQERGGWRPAFRVEVREEPDLRFARFGRRDGAPKYPQAVTAFANYMDVTAESLLRLGMDGIAKAELAVMGTYARENVACFPMFDASENTIGVRLRTRDGGKFAIKGSRNGLFIPTGRPAPFDMLLVSEGESDAAALLDLGFYVIGKPGADNADPFVVGYVKRHHPATVVVVADNDDVGRSRAERLGGCLAAEHRDVRVIRPIDGVKDARAWKQAGADRATLLAAIAAAERVRLTVRVQERGA